jgi:WD40 repeat protein
MKQFLCICVLTALLAGCFEERITWSPDGNHALVRGDDVYLSDTSGNLSPLGVGGASCVAWMPDGKRFVAAVPVALKTWDEARAKFPADAAAAAANAAAVRTELLAWQGKWDDFAGSVTKKLNMTTGQLILTTMYLRETDAPALQAKLGKDNWRNLLGAEVSYAQVRLFTIEGQKATVGPTLYETAFDGGISALRPAPTGAAVAISVNVPSTNSRPNELVAVPADDSGKTCDLGLAADQPDWSPDGKYLIYVRPAGWHNDESNELPLGMLSRRQVTDDKGALLPTEQLPKEEDLAGLMFTGETRVRVARDGRIFFDAAEINLPTTPQDMVTGASIFSFDPGKAATLTRVIPRGTAQTLGDSGNFELSPDARYISIPFNNGRVSVLDVATGVGMIVQDNAVDSESGNQMVPQWRTATELTFLRPPLQPAGVGALVRYSMTDKSATVMSFGWENGPLKELVIPKPATRPSGSDHVGQ